ncbi:MAG TPA: MBL fold metallo-hydrolase [Streptosporangiaceae bacterium]|nr:MBL fold metallo-hydrolase [Streptosporangiaceae bacterium]
MRELAEVAAGVLVATAVQYTTTSTVVLGAGGSCLVVDPSVTVAEVSGLADELARRNLRPVAGWATHAHWDHLLWCAELGDVPRYSTQRGVELAQRERAGLIEGVNAAAPGHDMDVFARLTVLDGNRIPWDGPATMLVEHDAHEVGHGAIFLPETGTLLAGDMLSDLEIPLLYPGDPDPVGQYRAGLELLAALDVVRTVVPGHGNVGDAIEFRRRVDADRRYLDKLESGVREADDERIGSAWLVSEHERQYSMLHS